MCSLLIGHSTSSIIITFHYLLHNYIFQILNFSMVEYIVVAAVIYFLMIRMAA